MPNNLNKIYKSIEVFHVTSHGMPSDAAHQAFWGSSFPQLCMTFVHYSMLFLYFLTTCLWRGVFVDVMKWHGFKTLDN